MSNGRDLSRKSRFVCVVVEGEANYASDEPVNKNHGNIVCRSLSTGCATGNIVFTDVAPRRRLEDGLFVVVKETVKGALCP